MRSLTLHPPGRTILAALPAVVLLTAGAGRADEVPTYNRDIRPILADRCFTCHGPDSAARQADLRLDLEEYAHAVAIVPGEAEESELIVRVASDDPDLKMPRSIRRSCR